MRIIELALLSGSSVNYISSVGALGDYSNEEWKFLNPYQLNKKGGYGQTKAVSERLIYQAYLNYQLRIRIFRPSAISGHLETGFSNQYDFTNLLLYTCYSEKCVMKGSNLKLRWIPVDFVGKAIVTLSRDPETFSLIFNMCGDGPLLIDVLNQIKSISMWKIKELTDEREWKKIISLIKQEHKSFAVKQILMNLNFYEENPPKVPCNNTETFIKKHNIEWPNITEENIVKYYHYLNQENYFK